MKKTAVFLAPGFEECEALMVVDLLRRANLETVTVSVDNTPEVTSSHQVTIKADLLMDEVKDELFDCIVMPGGLPGTTNLMASKPLTDIIFKHHQEGKLLAAICAAPSVYGVLGLLEGKQAICFPGFEKNLKGAEILNQKTVKAGNIITAKGLGASFEFGHAIITELQDKETADKVLAAVQY